ncbi:MAG: DNA replication/repair protein RecF [Polyangia bacterium]
MRILALRAAGWRNLAALEVAFDPGVRLNVLSGDNGQGKTNVLEAIYYLSAFRSFRTSRAIDLVTRGAAATHIAVEAQGRELVRTIEAQLTVRDSGLLANAEAPSGDITPPAGGIAMGEPAARDPAAREPSAREPSDSAVGRAIKVDGKPVRGLAAAFGVLSVVLFVPEDLMLIRAPPAARRRFVDMAISGVEPAYFGEAAAFQKILRSRNAVLRTGRGAVSSTLLDTYDEQLARAGARVVMRRRDLVRALAPDVDGVFRSLHGDLPVGLSYLSDPAVATAVTETDVGSALLAGLARRRTLDERRGHTTFGPQTDDVDIRLAGRPAREHASQGQLRSLVLAMKLGELAHVEGRRGEPPVLLLDDVPSELDPTRRRYLFETLAALSCQTLVSVADPTVVPSLSGRADFAVRGGTLTPLPVFALQTSS